ncbi:MAG TPA: methyltransferase domain-containing protein [Thermoanaerobaculia bacterium]|jgi:SAM-dependent methyltransferase
MAYCCVDCHTSLRETLDCPNCGRAYPSTDGIADFSGGHYFDSFHDENELSAEARAGLEGEVQGTLERIERYYGPLLRRGIGKGRVLDSGCGNGLSVEVLRRHGFDAWGHDLSQLRRWQWRSLPHRDRLSVADGRKLPFADGFFDAVLSSGVIEHIGVEESRDGGTYTVRPTPSRDDDRRAYLRELLRVVKPGGVVFVDCPNGAFPVDFWHSEGPGKPRAHSLSEGFLPTLRELRALVPDAGMVAVSPYNRLQFRQVGRHWYGRLLTLPMRALFQISRAVPFVRPLMPYLVVRITR